MHGGCDDGAAQGRVHFKEQRHVGHGFSIHHQPGACWEGAGEGGTCVSLCRPCSQGPGAEGPRGAAARGRWDRCIWPQLECTPPNASPAPQAGTHIHPITSETGRHTLPSDSPPVRPTHTHPSNPPLPHPMPTPSPHPTPIPRPSSSQTSLPGLPRLPSCLQTPRQLPCKQPPPQNQQTHEHSVLTTHPSTTHPGLPTPPAPPYCLGLPTQQDTKLLSCRPLRPLVPGSYPAGTRQPGTIRSTRPTCLQPARLPRPNRTEQQPYFLPTCGLRFQRHGRHVPLLHQVHVRALLAGTQQLKALPPAGGWSVDEVEVACVQGVGGWVGV